MKILCTLALIALLASLSGCVVTPDYRYSGGPDGYYYGQSSSVVYDDGYPYASGYSYPYGYAPGYWSGGTYIYYSNTHYRRDDHWHGDRGDDRWHGGGDDHWHGDRRGDHGRDDHHGHSHDSFGQRAAREVHSGAEGQSRPVSHPSHPMPRVSHGSSSHTSGDRGGKQRNRGGGDYRHHH